MILRNISTLVNKFPVLQSVTTEIISLWRLFIDYLRRQLLFVQNYVVISIYHKGAVFQYFPKLYGVYYYNFYNYTQKDEHVFQDFFVCIVLPYLCLDTHNYLKSFRWLTFSLLRLIPFIHGLLVIQHVLFKLQFSS